MLKLFAIIVAVAVASVLLFAATRPDTFRVERTTSIKASPEKILPLISDLRRFNAWNPYAKKDPNLKGSYSGAGSIEVRPIRPIRETVAGAAKT